MTLCRLLLDDSTTQGRHNHSNCMGNMFSTFEKWKIEDKVYEKI